MTNRLLNDPVTHQPLTQADLIAFWTRPRAEIDCDAQGLWRRMHSAMSVLFVALRPEGYRRETGQAAFTIAVPADADLAAIQAEIELVLPHIVPFVFEERRWADLGPVRVLSIFEHTLSDPCSYALLIAADNQAHVVDHLFGRWSFASLTEALAHIQRYHWYGGTPATATAMAEGDA